MSSVDEIHSKLPYKRAKWWIPTCCDISHLCSPSYIPAVSVTVIFFWDFLSHRFILFHDFSHGFFFLSPFLFYLFLFCCCCVCRPPLPSRLLRPCAGCKTAVELRWESRELQRHQGEQAICAFVCGYMCMCVLMLVCRTAQWFDIARH